MDHHCPIAGTCIGVRNQRHIAFALWDMALGQSIFLWCSYTHIAALPGPWILGGFTLDPWAMTLFLVQCLATPYCLVLALRMTGGIAANLTVNEMENAHRYEYLQEPDEGASAFARAEKTSSNETSRGGDPGDAHGRKAPEGVREPLRPRRREQLPGVLARAPGARGLGRAENRGGARRGAVVAARLVRLAA